MTEEPPLKAVVLDNDETTGSYGLLFALIVVFREVKTITNVTFKSILKKMAVWMLENNLFRPGILKLLKTVVELRKRGFIDKVIMYTNQTEIPYTTYYLDSVPYCISFMMNCISKNNIFDSILAKDAYSPFANQYTPKSFDRILNLFINKPRDIRGIIFVDDLASPEYIHSNTISPHLQSPDCWYSISKYYKHLSKQDVYDCLKYILSTNMLADIYIERVWEAYQKYLPKGETSLITDLDIISLCETLENKFGPIV